MGKISTIGVTSLGYLMRWKGPTPVSALIHVATLVTAGVFLIIRCSALYESSSALLISVSFLGGITALFAASVALGQNDIKKVIAYSTCSQLGYMVLACGLSAYYASLFHLFNHAFLKHYYFWLLDLLFIR